MQSSSRPPFGQEGVPQASEVVLVAKKKPGPKSRARASTPAASSSSSSAAVPLVVDAGSRERSRSPVRAALPGLRRDAPGRREVAPARMPDLALHSDRVAAIAALERDVLAASTTRTNSARLGTISSMLALWGLEPFPPTPTTWKALAATLKQGGYRSAAVYLSCYKLECERRGFPGDFGTDRLIKDYTRSCSKGFGGCSSPTAT